jgi:uncharacterized membrane-anchored protein
MKTLDVTFTRVIGIVFFALVALPTMGIAQDDTIFKKIQALEWKYVSAPGNIAGKATIKLDGGLRFLDSSNTSEFLTLQGNLPNSSLFTVAATNLSWFSVFKFVDEGYVKDDEKIDPDALLKILKENDAQATAERKKRGLPGLFLEGWFISPRYDRETKRLEWATLLRTDSGEKIINFSTKILGRHGHTDVILVSDPSSLDKDIGEFKIALKGFAYVPNEGYSEWKPGDKVAEYGLGALVLGGAAAIATKKGLWALLSGLIVAGWKIAAGLAVAALAGIGSLFKRKKS